MDTILYINNLILYLNEFIFNNVLIQEVILFSRFWNDVKKN